MSDANLLKWIFCYKHVKKSQVTRHVLVTFQNKGHICDASISNDSVQNHHAMNNECVVMFHNNSIKQLTFCRQDYHYRPRT